MKVAELLLIKVYSFAFLKNSQCACLKFRRILTTTFCLASPQWFGCILTRVTNLAEHFFLSWPFLKGSFLERCGSVFVCPLKVNGYTFRESYSAISFLQVNEDG